MDWAWEFTDQIKSRFLPCFTPWFFVADWKYRHAALMAISAIAEGCVKQMVNVLPNVVELVIPYLQDPHPRVRHATCNALGQLATDFRVYFQKKFHANVMPGSLYILCYRISFKCGHFQLILFMNIELRSDKGLKNPSVKIKKQKWLRFEKYRGKWGLTYFSQPAFICSKSIYEQYVKYVQN